MEYLFKALDMLMHLDKHLVDLTAAYGQWTYAVLFSIVFCETGLVVTPFLPGDSLLFATGAISALGTLSPVKLAVTLFFAAIIGDNTNYWIGRFLGPKVFSREDSIVLNKKHLERTQRFYEKYGTKTIVIARFVPIIRTFAPFVAGIGRMRYSKFISFSVLGGLLWISLFISGGYFFGNLPLVKRNFTIVIFVIIILSVMPAIVEVLRHKFERKE
ncbi:DedA family protein [Candidatus Magnetomonas plexicatena]|uniref:DedA family protein n=1 Tax=Candidatus Magnetomonas plexicatena TaxID=2552947 RepID=UPI001C74C6A6|nr:DedA family protein [Nitrospirales bacterium LBB_01]